MRPQLHVQPQRNEAPPGTNMSLALGDLLRVAHLRSFSPTTVSNSVLELDVGMFSISIHEDLHALEASECSGLEASRISRSRPRIRFCTNCPMTTLGKRFVRETSRRLVRKMKLSVVQRKIVNGGLRWQRERSHGLTVVETSPDYKNMVNNVVTASDLSLSSGYDVLI